MEKKSSHVCVTGAAGYIGSWLVKKLLDRGHVVHATLRNLGDDSKTGLLKSLPGAESRLLLFEANIYEPHQFEAAIQGCEFVFLVATPLQHNPHSSQYKDTTEAAVSAIQSIMLSCERSGTVKRVIYTGSITASSPLKEDCTGFKDFIDESCWTPLSIPYAYCEDHEKGYTTSKTLSEREVLSFNRREGIEVVSLVCGLVGGNTLLSYVPTSVRVIISPLIGDALCHRQLKFLQALLGSIPLVHIEDICEAHVFCMERPSIMGRFLCVSGQLKLQAIADYYMQQFPKFIMTKEVEGSERTIECKSTKLADMGFEYKYDAKQILDESLECAKQLGELNEVIKP